MSEKPTLHIDPFERLWIIVGIVLLVTFTVLVSVAAMAGGIQVPAPELRVDPNTVATTGPFAQPGLRELAPGKYEAYILARTFIFMPRDISVPVGSSVTFYVTSADVQHGFAIRDTNINMQIVPGQVSKLTYTFSKAGVYPFICHEYCGIGHAAMFGQVTVTEK